MRGTRAACLVVATAILTAGCASTRPAAVPVAPAPSRVDDFNALIARGCFRCLEHAYELAQARGAGPQAFEAAALLVLRSKELGLPFEDWRVKARAAAPEGDAYAWYLTMADAIAPDRFSEERYTLFELGVRNARASVPEWRERSARRPGDGALSQLPGSVARLRVRPRGRERGELHRRAGSGGRRRRCISTRSASVTPAKRRG